MRRAAAFGAALGAATLAYGRGRRASGGAELHVYDFDGTLFRSPSSPAVWRGDWWSMGESLLPPCVPMHPDARWWISPTVKSARKSIANPDVFAIMLTGRGDREALRYRVPDLLHQHQLNFDAVHLDPGGNAIRNKVARVRDYLQRYPFITKVQIWDDRASHLVEFQAGLPSSRVTVIPHHVTALSRGAQCEVVPLQVTPRKSPSYAGVVLDSKSRGALQYAFPLAHDKIENDHVTLVYRPKPEDQAWLSQWLGRKVRMQVVGYAEDDLGQAVAVRFLDPVPYPKGGIPHVTLSRHRSVPPEYSNELLARGAWSGAQRVKLSGVVDTHPSSLRRTK